LPVTSSLRATVSARATGFTIRVLGQQDLTGDYIVDASGNISLPLVRSLAVAGLSTADIETQITERLKQGFLRNPSVSVQLAIARPFYIMGQVNQAGSFSYRPGMTAQNAIAMAGGFLSACRPVLRAGDPSPRERNEDTARAGHHAASPW
jgi:protein involved in polysaccharide export with SLBB domain